MIRHLIYKNENAHYIMLTKNFKIFIKIIIDLFIKYGQSIFIL